MILKIGPVHCIELLDMATFAFFYNGGKIIFIQIELLSQCTNLKKWEV